MRRALLSLGMASLIALLLPAIASATWTHKGKGELTESASITVSGDVTLTTSIGAITCPTTIGATLTKESSEGHVNSYTVSEPAACDLTGSLGAVCGTNGVSEVEKTGSWKLSAKDEDMAVSGLSLDYEFKKCAITGLRVKGDATLSVVGPLAIKTVTFSGVQTVYNASEEEIGSAQLGGSLSVSPNGTYGLREEGEGVLVDAEGPIDEHVEIHLLLHEQFEFLGSGFACAVDWTLTTTDGTTATTVISDADTTLETCEFYGLYEGCELKTDEPEELPWQAHPYENSLRVTDSARARTFEASESCLFHTTNIYFPHIKIVVDDPITEGALSEPDGKGVNEGLATGTLANDETFELPIAPAGALTVESEASGTYRLI